MKDYNVYYSRVRFYQDTPGSRILPVSSFDSYNLYIGALAVAGFYLGHGISL